MSTMKAARFASKGANIEIVDVPIPKVGKGEVRIQVYACGVCHSDTFTKYGAYGNAFPRIPGHEVAGVVDEVGEGVNGFKKGDKVGVGWFGGHCGECNSCLKNRWVACEKGKVCGIHYDGGYAEYTVVPSDAVVRLPNEMDFKFAAPLMCAGITTFNGIRSQGLIAGDICVVQGLGGLGHLGVQFANKMGYKVIAVSSGKEKEELAKKLGAHHYIDSSSVDAVAEIKKLGGANLVIATAPHASAIEGIYKCLTLGGKLLIVAAVTEPIKIDSLFLLSNNCSVIGWPSGDSRDSEETAKFAQLTGVQSMIETFPLEKAQEAFDKMMENKVRFRSVLVLKK